MGNSGIFTPPEGEDDKHAYHTPMEQFVMDLRLGIITWLVAVAHEIPQELGDFYHTHTQWMEETNSFDF